MAKGPLIARATPKRRARLIFAGTIFISYLKGFKILGIGSGNPKP